MRSDHQSLWKHYEEKHDWRSIDLSDNDKEKETIEINKKFKKRDLISKQNIKQLNEFVFASFAKKIISS